MSSVELGRPCGTALAMHVPTHLKYGIGTVRYLLFTYLRDSCRAHGNPDQAGCRGVSKLAVINK